MAVRAVHLRLEAGEDAEGLRIPLEASDVDRPGIERRLAVVAVGRVAEIVAEARAVDDVGIEAERGAELAPDLGDLERMREPVPCEVEPGRG